MTTLYKFIKCKIVYTLYILLFVLTCSEKNPTVNSTLDDATLTTSVTKSYKMVNNLIFPEDTIKALVIGGSDAPLENIRIEFDIISDIPGQLTNDYQLTNSSGEARTLYSLNENYIDNLTFSDDTSLTIIVGVAAGEDENSMVLNNTLQWDIELSYQGNPYQIEWFNFKDPTLDTLIINISQTDTIIVTARNQNGVAVCNVPVHFSIKAKQDALGQAVPDDGSVPPFGVLTSEVAFTCLDGDPEFGEAEISYQNLHAGADQLFAKIIHDVNEDSTLFLDSLIIINIDSTTYDSPINSVSSFHFYPNNDNLINLASEEIDISVIALNDEGANICDIPVFFQLIGENFQSSSNGFIDNNIAITCDDSEIDSTDNSSTATITYQNINGGIDYLIASLIDVLDQSSILPDTLKIETVGSTLLIDDVESINCNMSSNYIVFTSPDSMKTDTIFSRALDNNNALIPGIPFEFSIITELDNSAYLSSGGAISDSNGIAYSILNVHQSIFSNSTDSLSIHVSVTIPSTELSESVSVTIIDQVSDWYEDSAELILTSNNYILPCTDCENETTALITANLQDSLLNPPPPGTVIEFSSLQKDTTGADDEINWEEIGNITPGAVFDENGLATALFNIGDDRGIAHIIGTVNELSDTIQIVIESTNASHIQILPPAIDEIMVQGGGGTESSLIEVIIIDDYENTIIDEEYQVYFQITGSPLGVTLDESGGSVVTKTSNFGTSNVTIVSGTSPGSVHLTVKLYNIDDDIESATPIAIAESIPLTVVTGPPEYGELNFSFLGIIPDEVGAVYHVPLSVYLEDLHSNPIADSTSVYFKLREVADTYNSAAEYGYEDKVTWLSPDSTSTTELDSIVYVCINQTEGCAIDIEPSNQTNWEAASYPAFIIGEGETNMINSSGESYPGIAYSEVTYGSSSIASEIIIFAQTYSTNNSILIIDSRDTHNGDGIVLPCYDCQIGIFALPTEWDFSLPPFDPDSEEDFQDVFIQATVTDHFQYYVNDALISLEAPQADFVFVCNGDDTDLDGGTGTCTSSIDGTTLELVDTCWECGEYAPDFFWDIEDSDANDIEDSDGTSLLIPDDIPNYARTNASGIGLWTIRYSEGVNIPQGADPVTYQAFLPTLTITLLTPSTNGPTATTTLTITKSEED